MKRLFVGMEYWRNGVMESRSFSDYIGDFNFSKPKIFSQK